MNEVVERTVDAYDKIVEEYFRQTVGIHGELADQAIKFLKYIPNNGSILDMGCGYGREAKIFSEKGFLVTGIDASSKSIDKAKTYAKVVDFKVMDFLSMDFGSEKFDGIWCNAAFFSIEKKYAKDLISSTYDLLNDNGVFFVSLKKGDGEGFEFDKRYGVEKYYAYYQEDEIMSLIESVGYKCLSVDVMNHDSEYHAHPWIRVLCRK